MQYCNTLGDMMTKDYIRNFANPVLELYDYKAIPARKLANRKAVHSAITETQYL